MKIILILQILSIAVGIEVMVISFFSMDNNVNDMITSARLICGSIVFAAGLIGISKHT